MQEMKYFNEGNDCDICKNQLMTGRDGTVEDCRRRQNGLSCRFEERDIRTCPVCEHEVDREDMYFTSIAFCPDVFRFLSVEGGAMALIKSVKTVTKKDTGKQHENEPDDINADNNEEVQG